MEKLNLERNNLKKFGISLGTVFCIITILFSLRHKHIIFPTAIIALTFFTLSLIAPNLLKPIYIFWMRLAFAVGWINTRLILLLVFYLVFVPIGFMVRLLRIDLLDRKINKDEDSYWIKRKHKPFSPADYQRQF